MKKYIRLILSVLMVNGFYCFSMNNLKHNNNQLVKQQWKNGLYSIKTLNMENDFYKKPSDIEFDNSGKYILFTTNDDEEKSIVGVYSIDNKNCIFGSQEIKNLDLRFQMPIKTKNNTIIKAVDYFIYSESDKRHDITWKWFNYNHPTTAYENSFVFQKPFSGVIVPLNHLISKSSKHIKNCDDIISEDGYNAIVIRDCYIKNEDIKYLALFGVADIDDKIELLCKKLMKYSKSLLVAMSNSGDIICVYDTNTNNLTFFKVLLKINDFSIKASQDEAFGNIYFEFSQ